MRIRFTIFALALFFATLTPCFAHHTAVIVNKDNAVGNLTSAQLTKISRGEVKKWSDGKNLVLVLHKDSIIFVDTDAEVIKAVQAEPGALGLIEVRSIDNSVSVIRVDGKLPMELGYLPH